MSFERIYKHITEKCNRLGTSARNPTIINEWLAAGYDTEKDIIPAIDWLLKITPDKNTINSFYRFTGVIKKFHSKRIVNETCDPVLSKEQKEKARAEAIRFVRDRGICSTRYCQHDFNWLDQYDKQHREIK